MAAQNAVDEQVTQAPVGDEAQGEGAPESTDREQQGQLAALEAERKARQEAQQLNRELKRDIRHLEQRFEDLRSNIPGRKEPEQRTAPEDDIDENLLFSDPKKAAALIRKKAVEEAKREIAAEQQRRNDEAYNRRLTRGIQRLKDEFGEDEVEETLEAFSARMKRDPGIADELQAAHDPARVAFQGQKAHEARKAKRKQRDGIGDDEWREFQEWKTSRGKRKPDDDEARGRPKSMADAGRGGATTSRNNSPATAEARFSALFKGNGPRNKRA